MNLSLGYFKVYWGIIGVKRRNGQLENVIQTYKLIAYETYFS